MNMQARQHDRYTTGAISLVSTMKLPVLGSELHIYLEQELHLANEDSHSANEKSEAKLAAIKVSISLVGSLWI
jgi:hypothetical protein